MWAAVQDLGWPVSFRQGMGLLVMLGCLAVEGLAARELVRRWRPAERREPGLAPATGSVPVRA
jgi:hypothetical protein